MCLTVKYRSAGALTPGSSGTLAQGAGTLSIEGRRAHPSDCSSAQSLCLVSSAAREEQRSEVIAPSPAFSASCGPWDKHLLLPTSGENGCPDSGRHHSRRQGWGLGAGGWAWAGCGQGLTWPEALPGHTVVQEVFWKAWPSQKAPPLSGVGLVQVRVRFCQPRPQRLEQGDHSAQLDHPPFTAGTTGVTPLAWLCDPMDPQTLSLHP